MKKALLGLALSVCWCQAGMGADAFYNYVVPANGYQAEVVLVNNDVMNPSNNYKTTFTAYSRAGEELASVFMDADILNGNRFITDFSDLFPEINAGDIGFVEIKSSNKNDVWVIYSNGDQKAMVPAPIDGASVVYNLHFTNNTGYWNFLNNIARINSDESVVRAVVYPGGEEMEFDGSTNPYGFLMPNLNAGMGAASINMKDFFGGTVPDDAAWMGIYSEHVQHTPAGDTVTPVHNLIANTLFMKTNGESGGAFGSTEAFEEWIVPHITQQDYYWWTGLVLNNPNDATVQFVIQYYSANGVHLDVDPGTPDVDDFHGELPPFGKVVDLINNLGRPDGTGYARIVAEKPIKAGELFGGEPSGANWPIMAGVGLLLPGTGGYLASVTDMNPPIFTYNIPLAESKNYTDTEEGLWTGLAFINLGKKSQDVFLEYKTESGLIIGTQLYTVGAMNKQAITVEDLLKQAGLEDIRDQVKQITVNGAGSGSLIDNREVIVYALQGGKQAGTGTHSWMIGEDAANTSPVDVKMFVANQTRGIVDSLEDLLGSMNIKVEDNDVILSHVISRLRDTKYGEITGYDVVAYDDNWNEVGSLGGFRRALHPEMSDKSYYVNFSSDKQVNSDVCPYDTPFKLGIKIHTTINGIEQTWTYRIPDKTITRTAEQDYDIDAIKGEGFSKNIVINKLDQIAEICSREGVDYYESNVNKGHKTFEEVKAILQTHINNNLDDWEMRYAQLNDVGQGGTYLFKMTNGLLGQWNSFRTQDEQVMYDLEVVNEVR